ncbi:hypothetical protein D3C85_1507200 [compost metagenome]
MEARLAAVVAGVEPLEAGQGAGGLAQVRCLGGADAGQAQLAEAAQAAHGQAQGRVAAELDGRMAEAHETRDRQPRLGLGQPCLVQAEALQQFLG